MFYTFPCRSPKPCHSDDDDDDDDDDDAITKVNCFTNDAVVVRCKTSDVPREIILKMQFVISVATP